MINKMLHNIFSKSKHKNKGSIQLTKIIIADVHEKNSLVLSYLQEIKQNFKIESLKIGDYIIGEIIIERKTLQDFISSMINKRLIKQLTELNKYKNRLLLIEGYPISDNTSFNLNAIRGMILSIELELKIPVVLTQDSKETALILSLLAKKQTSHDDLTLHSKKGLTKKQQIRYILEGFSGIGPKNSEKLLKNFGTIKSVINSNEKDLTKVIGKKSEIFKLVDEKY